MTPETALPPPPWRRAIRYRISQTLRHSFAWALFRLPSTWPFTVARWLARTKYRFVRNRYRRYAEEITSCLNVSPEEADRVIERCFELTVSEHLDTSRYRRMTREDLDQVIEIRGLEHLERALADGKGAVLYSGHVCGHYTFFLALSLLGFPVNMLGFVESQDRWMARRWRSFFDRRFRMLWMKKGSFGIAVQAINALRRNGVVTVEIDHTTSKPMIEVEFLSRPANFPSGPALIAQAAGAPLLHFWVNRSEAWVPQTATIGPPFYVAEDITTAVTHCAKTLEAEVLADPASWLTWLFPRKFLWADGEGS